MNYTHNEKIEQISDTTLVIGIDIGSQTHYARAFDNRARELYPLTKCFAVFMPPVFPAP